jgi:hypothetical protein
MMFSQGQVSLIRIKSPLDCLPEEKNAFIRLIENGNQVTAKNLDKRVNRAKFLAFYEEADVLVGVGAIKRPYGSYRNRIFDKAESNAIPEQYNVELGWIVVCREFGAHGIGTTIVRDLLGKVEGTKIFATTSNDKMKHILKCKFDFLQSGSEYKSCKGRQLVLLVRDCCK